MARSRSLIPSLPVGAAALLCVVLGSCAGLLNLFSFSLDAGPPTDDRIRVDPLPLVLLGVVVFLLLGTRGFPWPRLRMMAGLLLLALLMAPPVPDHEPAELTLILGTPLVCLFIADEYVSTHTERWPVRLAAGLLLAVFLTWLALNLDRARRVYVGLEPAERRRQDAPSGWSNYRDDFGVITTRAWAPAAGLEALGSNGGDLAVLRADGTRCPLMGNEKRKKHCAQALVFSADEHFLALADCYWNDPSEATVTVWRRRGDSDTFQLEHTFQVSGHGIYALAFLPNGRRLIGCGDHDHVHLWDVATGGELARYCPRGETAGMLFHIRIISPNPAGDRFATWSCDRGGLILWQVNPLEPVRRFGSTYFDTPESLTFDADSRSLLAQHGGTWERWEIEPSPARFQALALLAVAMLGALLLTVPKSEPAACAGLDVERKES